MRISKPILVLPIVSALALTACTDVGPRQSTGAVGGAVAGGVLGGLLGKSAGTAAVGAVAGGIVGGLIGQQLDAQAGERVLAASLNKYPNTHVQVIGHTDNTGAASYNLDLSRRRASTVANSLVGSGVSAGRVSAYGKGEDQPIASNLTASGRAQNRRVEIIIIPNN
ncbi:MAG: OmpA family protein [Maritimibacter sp.]